MVMRRDLIMRDSPFTNEIPTMNFRGVMSEIFWNWQLHSDMLYHQLERGEDPDRGPYISVDKLCITPTHASYKTSNWTLEPGVWEKLNIFLDCVVPMLEPFDTKDNQSSP